MTFVDVTEPSGQAVSSWRQFNIPAPHLNLPYHEQFSFYSFVLNCFRLLFSSSLFFLVFALSKQWQHHDLELNRHRKSLRLCNFALVSCRIMECSFHERGPSSFGCRWVMVRVLVPIFEAKLRLPTTDFFNEIMIQYGFSVDDLTPNLVCFPNFGHLRLTLTRRCSPMFTPSLRGRTST